MYLKKIEFLKNFQNFKIFSDKKIDGVENFFSQKYFFFYCKNFPLLIQKRKDFSYKTIENFFFKKNNLMANIEENQDFPRIWSIERRYQWLFEKKKNSGWGDLEISSNNLKIKYRGFGKTDEDAAGIGADTFIPNNLFIFYFEIKILNPGKNGFIGIGLCEKNTNLDRLPGWEKNSLGYHGDDGFFFRDSGTGMPYGPCYGKNDVVGVCLNFVEKTVFFTKNGLGLQNIFVNTLTDNSTNPIPFIGLRTKGECIQGNFGDKVFEFDLNSYKTHFQKIYERKIFFFFRFFYKNLLSLVSLKTQKYKNLKKKKKNKENFQNLLFRSFFLSKKTHILKIFASDYYLRSFFFFLKNFFSEKLFFEKKIWAKSYFLLLFFFKNILSFVLNFKKFFININSENAEKNILLERKKIKFDFLEKKILFFFGKKKLSPVGKKFFYIPQTIKSFFKPIFKLFLKILFKWRKKSNLSFKINIRYSFLPGKFLKKKKFFIIKNFFHFFNTILVLYIHKRIELFDLRNWIK